MALSITNRGTGTHNTSATSFTLSPGSNFAAGATAVLCVAADNSASGGSSNNFTTVTDSLGNTWTKQQSPVFDNGAANAGVQGAIYTTQQDGGTLQTSTTITVNFGASTVAKTWTLTEVVAASGKRADFVAGGNKAAGATATAATSDASGTINIGQASVFAIFIEAGTTQTCTGDSDTTNGSWSTLQYAEIGSTTSGSCIASQGKVQTTANSTQTYNVTLGISSDYHASWVVLQENTYATPTEAVSPAVAIAPTITLGALSVTPTEAISAAVAVDPTITLGTLNVTPTQAVSTAVAIDPTVDNQASGQNVTPIQAVSASAAIDPTITLGTLDVTPIVAISASTGIAPTITLGGITVTPTQAVSSAIATDPTITLGTLNVTPTVAVSATVAITPTLTFGGITVTPVTAITSAVAVAPTTTFGAISVTPGTAVSTDTAANPTVTLGTLNVTPTVAIAAATAADPSAFIGYFVTPPAAISTAVATNPTITLGEITATLGTAISTATAIPLNTTLGTLNITPPAAIASAIAIGLVVDNGLTVVPTPGIATAIAFDPLISQVVWAVPAPAISQARAMALSIVGEVITQTDLGVTLGNYHSGVYSGDIGGYTSPSDNTPSHGAILGGASNGITIRGGS